MEGPAWLAAGLEVISIIERCPLDGDAPGLRGCGGHPVGIAALTVPAADRTGD